MEDENVVVRTFSTQARLFMVLLLTASGCATSPSPAEKAEQYAAEIRSSGSGVREFRGSTIDTTGPIPVLILKGSPYEQGLAYGALLRKELIEVSKINESWARHSMKATPGAASSLSGIARSIHLQQLENRTPPDYLAEIKGAADGAGVPYQDILLAAYAAYDQAACTSILTAGEGISGILHGRNFDFHPNFLGRYPVIVKYVFSGPEKSSYWNIGVIGYLPSFNGFNEAGVSVSINRCGKNRLKPNGLPMGWKVRELLLRSRRLRDARQVMQETANDNFDWAVAVGSASERAGLVFDLKDDIQAETVTRPNQPLVVLNRVFGDGRQVESGLAAKHLDVSQNIHWSNAQRWAAAQDFLRQRPLANMADLWRLLRNRDNPDGDAIFASSGTTIARTDTLFSMVFDLAVDRITLAAGETYAALRTVWLFQPSTGGWSEFLPPDPMTLTENFQRRERTYQSLQQSLLAGTLTLDRLAGLNANEIDPFALDEFGWQLQYLKSRDPRLSELLRSLAEKYDTYGYSKAVYAKSLLSSDRKAAVRMLAEATERAAVSDFLSLLLLSDLVDLYGEEGKTNLAAEAARRWLALKEKVCRGYSSTSGWLDNCEVKMKGFLR